MREYKEETNKHLRFKAKSCMGSSHIKHEINSADYLSLLSEHFEIEIEDEIFYQKLGKYKETENILRSFGFR